MKAIVLIDMPEKCLNCPLMTDDMYCKGFTPYIKENVAITKMCVEDDVMRGTRHTHCPLKPMPKKRGKITLTERTQDIDNLKWQLECNIYSEGFNACIDKILGEQQ